MSAGSVKKAGAAYEAVLVDNVSAKVDQIVQSLDQLKAAFDDINPSARDLNKEMTGIGTAMTEMRKKAQAPFKLGAQMQKIGGIISNASISIGQSLIHIGNQFRMVGLAATAAATTIAVSLTMFARKAGDATETVSAFRAVFRESAAGMGAWADSLAKSIGRSGNEMRKGLTSFRAFFTGLGIGNEQADEMSMRFQRLAIDFSSFFNLTDEEGMQRFIGGMSGASENLLRFGINVQEAALSNTEYAESLGKTSAEMTQLEKVFARAEIISKVMKDINAEGDAFRTRFSLQNQIKSLGAAFADFQVKVGGLLEGPAKDIVTSVRAIFNGLSQLSMSNLQPVIGGMVTLFAAGGVFATAGTIMAALGPAITAIGTAFGGLTSILAAMIPVLAANPLLIPGVIAGVLAAGTAAIGAFKGVLETDLLMVLDVIKDSFEGVADAALEGMKAIANALKAENYQLAWDIFKFTALTVFEEIAEGLRKLLAVAINQALGGVVEIFSPTPDPETGGIPSLGKRMENARDQLLDAAFAPSLREQGIESVNQKQLRELAAQAEKEGKLADEAAEKQGEFNKNLDEINEGMRESIGKMNAAEAEAAAAQAEADAESEFLDTGALGSVIETIKRDFASIGGFGAGFASMAGNFAPVMSPIERNQEKIIETLEFSLNEQQTMNENLQNLEMTMQ